jgi:hypothetical protein
VRAVPGRTPGHGRASGPHCCALAGARRCPTRGRCANRGCRAPLAALQGQHRVQWCARARDSRTPRSSNREARRGRNPSQKDGRDGRGARTKNQPAVSDLFLCPRTRPSLLPAASRLAALAQGAGCAAVRFMSSGAEYDVAIIGGGPGGYVAAIKAAQLGLKTVDCFSGFFVRALSCGGLFV